MDITSSIWNKDSYFNLWIKTITITSKAALLFINAQVNFMPISKVPLFIMDPLISWPPSCVSSWEALNTDPFLPFKPPSDLSFLSTLWCIIVFLLLHYFIVSSFHFCIWLTFFPRLISFLNICFFGLCWSLNCNIAKAHWGFTTMLSNLSPFHNNNL